MDEREKALAEISEQLREKPLPYLVGVLEELHAQHLRTPQVKTATRYEVGDALPKMIRHTVRLITAENPVGAIGCEGDVLIGALRYGAYEIPNTKLRAQKAKILNRGCILLLRDGTVLPFFMESVGYKGFGEHTGRYIEKYKIAAYYAIVECRRSRDRSWERDPEFIEAATKMGFTV